jgi:NhaC family Na+:H+ antiporter
MTDTDHQIKRPSLGISLIPIIVLIALLALNVFLYGDDSLGGSNQMTLLISGTVAALLSLTFGVKWKTLYKGIVKSIGSALGALMILLLIGSLAGTWIMSGIVPAMIYYGLDILTPSIFLFATCVICIVVSLATGSSWTTVATVGIALLGIGSALGIDESIIAGAIISGAYFGDKMSPLSDTTNLAPAMAGTDLFTHIKYMAWTTIPSIILTLIIFLIIGFTSSSDGNAANIEPLQKAITDSFYISPILFLVPIIVILMIVKKVPAIPALLAGAILGGVFAIAFQPDIIKGQGTLTELKYEAPEMKNTVISWDQSDKDKVEWAAPGTHTLTITDTVTKSTDAITIVVPPHWKTSMKDKSGTVTINGKEHKIKLDAYRTPYALSSYIAVVNAMTTDMVYETGNAEVNKLLESGGMAGMLNTIWLIICAMSFGGIMEATGMLQRIAQAILTLAKSTASLVATTTGTCIFFNVTASDQYLSIVVPGRMFAGEYKKRGLQPQLLSRTLEDSGTVTSALVPWNTCGAYHAGVLGVATGDYFMYAFFNLISPIMTVLFGFMGWGIAPPNPEIVEGSTEEEAAIEV